MKTIALIVNSNMLPHGARCAASARIATPPTLSPNAMMVSDTPTRPNVSTRCRTPADPAPSPAT
jgi:hypothetical protein